MFELPNSEQQRNDPFNGRDVSTNSGTHQRGGEANVKFTPAVPDRGHDAMNVA